MIAAIMHQRERLPRVSEDGNQNHERADTLVGVLRGTISEERVDELENDDKLSETDAETCREAFRWLQDDDSVKLVDDEDLLAVAPEAKDDPDAIAASAEVDTGDPNAVDESTAASAAPGTSE